MNRLILPILIVVVFKIIEIASKSGNKKENKKKNKSQWKDFVSELQLDLEGQTVKTAYTTEEFQTTESDISKRDEKDKKVFVKKKKKKKNNEIPKTELIQVDNEKHDMIEQRENKGFLVAEENELIKAVIFSEILGSPKALRGK